MSNSVANLMPFLGALITAVLTAGAQTCLKLGMTSVTSGNDSGGVLPTLQYFVSVLLNPFVIAGLIGYLLSTLLWLYVLSRLPLSTAYPFVGISIVLTCMFGIFLLNEPSSTSKLVGITLVFAGVVLVSRG